MVDGGAASVGQFGFVAAGVFGFLGSTHCAGMCGPLVGLYAKQLQDQPTWRIQRQHLLYNFGRLLMYTNLGILLGGAGSLIGLLPWAAGVLGVLSGLFIAAMGLCLIGADGTARIIAYVTQSVTIGWRWHSRLARSSNILMLGALHGFLPCPLLYVMFTSAVAMQNPIHGGLLLFGFGLGTIPMMWAMGALAGKLSMLNRFVFQRVYGIAVAAWGGVLLFHGVLALRGF